MKIEYCPTGTCSRKIEIDVEDGVVRNVCVSGGCSGNLQGVAALCRGRRALEVAAVLEGIKCGTKSTSCPDQIAQAIRSAIKDDENG